MLYLCLYSERDSNLWVSKAENLLRHSAVHDVVLVEYFKQLVTGSDAGQLHVDSLDRQFIAAYVTIVRNCTERIFMHAD